MKKYFILLSLTFLLVGLYAVPTAYLGNIRVPNAYVMPGNMVTGWFNSYFAADDWRDPDDLNSPSHRDKTYDYYWSGALNVGIMNRLEVGFVGTGEQLYFGNAKVKLLEETVQFPAITIGVDNLFSKVPTDLYKKREKYVAVVNGVADTLVRYPDLDKWRKDVFEPDMYERNSFYGAVTKSSVIRGLGIANYLEAILTLGYGINRFEGQNEITHKLKGFLVGLELKPNPNTSILAEMDGYNLNAGLRYSYRNFMGQISALQIEQYQSLRIALNVGYTFDKYVTTPRPNVLFGLEGGKQEFAGRRTVTSPEELKQSNELLDELKMIRDRREQAEKELEEIKKILQEQE